MQWPNKKCDGLDDAEQMLFCCNKATCLCRRVLFQNGSQSFTVPSLFYFYKNRDSWYDEIEKFGCGYTIWMRIRLFLFHFEKGSQSQFSIAPLLVLKLLYHDDAYRDVLGTIFCCNKTAQLISNSPGHF